MFVVNLSEKVICESQKYETVEKYVVEYFIFVVRIIMYIFVDYFYINIRQKHC